MVLPPCTWRRVQQPIHVQTHSRWHKQTQHQHSSTTQHVSLSGQDGDHRDLLRFRQQVCRDVLLVLRPALRARLSYLRLCQRGHRAVAVQTCRNAHTTASEDAAWHGWQSPPAITTCHKYLRIHRCGGSW